MKMNFSFKQYLLNLFGLLPITLILTMCYFSSGSSELDIDRINTDILRDENFIPHSNGKVQTRNTFYFMDLENIQKLFSKRNLPPWRSHHNRGEFLPAFEMVCSHGLWLRDGN